MIFRLKQKNIDHIEKWLMDVSHPGSSNYGKHWTPQKVADAFAPKKESVDAVRNWLHVAGFSPDRIRLSNSRGWLEMNATTAEVEQLLKAEYHVYSHEYGAQHIGRCQIEQLTAAGTHCHLYSLRFLHGSGTYQGSH